MIAVESVGVVGDAAAIALEVGLRRSLAAKVVAVVVHPIEAAEVRIAPGITASTGARRWRRPVPRIHGGVGHTANPVIAAIKAVWVGLVEREAPDADLSTVKVQWIGRNTDGRMGRITASST